MSDHDSSSFLLPLSADVENLLDLEGTEALRIGDQVISAENLTKAATLMQGLPADAVPTNRAGLTDGWSQFYFSVLRNTAASLKLFAAAELEASDQVVLHQLAFYKELHDEDAYLLARYGSGIELALKISTLNASASLNTLQGLAASVEFGYARVRYKLRTFGMSGPKVTDAIPSSGILADFSVDALTEIFGAVDKIKTAFEDPSTTVTPKRMAIKIDIANAEVQYHRALATLWALSCIRDGKRCGDAQHYVPVGSDLVKQTIQAVYEQVSGRCSRKTSPDQIAQIKARQILQPFGYAELLRPA